MEANEPTELEDLEAVISEIALIVANSKHWNNPDQVAYHRGFIMGLINNGLNRSIINTDIV